VVAMHGRLLLRRWGGVGAGRRGRRGRAGRRLRRRARRRRRADGHNIGLSRLFIDLRDIDIGLRHHYKRLS
jgi:hypothetical protein